MGFDGLAYLHDISARIDNAHAIRLRLGSRQVRAAHALEKRAVLALAAVQRLAGRREPLPCHLVAAVEDQRSLGPQARMYRIAEPLDQLRLYALAGALVGGGRIREAGADNPAARGEPR